MTFEIHTLEQRISSLFKIIYKRKSANESKTITQ